MKLLPIDLSCQLLPGTFEHALSHLIDHELDLRVLDERFRNDITGAPAYAPAVLLKVILFAYARGMIRKYGVKSCIIATQRTTNFSVRLARSNVVKAASKCNSQMVGACAYFTFRNVLAHEGKIIDIPIFVRARWRRWRISHNGNTYNIF